MTELQQRVMRFSQELAETKREIYARRNQFDFEKIVSDIYTSKLSEWAAYRFLMKTQSFQPSAPPLMDILERPNWDADLENDQYKFAVKLCVSPSFGLSWTFQVQDPILGKQDPNYKVVFMLMESQDSFIVYGTSDTQKLHGEYIFEDGTDLAQLKGIKLFVKANKTRSIKKLNVRVRI